MVSRWLIAAAGLAVLAAVRVGAGGEIESQRLDDDAFRKGLLDRGLIGLLEYHLEAFPPEDALTELSFRRNISLRAWNDLLADQTSRHRALVRANDLLARMIATAPADERRTDWRLELASSLIYEQAEPFFSSILYRGGANDDRARLGEVMDRALELLTATLDDLQREYARIDDLSVEQYEELDAGGHVAEVEAAMPRARYMLGWARFYKALSLEDQSPQRRRLLEDVLRELTQKSSLLTVDHSQTHVRAQSLLLAGMASRRLADCESAARYLQDAVEVARQVRDAQEHRDLQWVVVLGLVERVRAQQDAGWFDAATETLDKLRDRIGQSTAQNSATENFGDRLIAGTLASDLLLARAKAARLRHDNSAANGLETRAFDALSALADQGSAYRDEIYARLYRRVRDVPDVDSLHPFERCALIAGHIAEGVRLRNLARATGSGAVESQVDKQRLEAAANQLFDQAGALAEALVRDRATVESSQYCEARYNLGVAQYHRGILAAAARSFATVAQECPGFDRARVAAVHAVELASQLSSEPSLRSRRDIQELGVRTLRILVEGFEGSAAAEYWRFYLGQAQEQLGEVDAAAKTYARVRPHHRRYLTAQLRAARCLVVALSALAARTDSPSSVLHKADEARHAIMRFQTLARESLIAGGESEEPTALRRMLAEAEVLHAEMNVLEQVGRVQEALDLLAGFEERYANHEEWMGRILRTRIVAYQATGQLDQAKLAVPAYIASAPAEAGATLQSLFDATRAEIDRNRRAGREDLAQQKIEAALLFAQELYDWARSEPAGVSKDGLHWFRLQLAEANLEHGNNENAVQLFRQCITEDASRQDDGLARDPRAVLGLARALYRTGDWAEALRLFNRMYRELPDESEGRFIALLGDLRCRTELGHDPAGILDAIAQHSFLEPELGGPALKQQFVELGHRNERRSKGRQQK